jgi:hypothetical protein
LSTHIRLGLPSGLFPCGFHTNILYAFPFSPIRATCPAHLILLDLIILIILEKSISYEAKISYLRFYIFSPIFPGICWDSTSVRPWLLFSQSISVYYSPVLLPLSLYGSRYCRINGHLCTILQSQLILDEWGIGFLSLVISFVLF